MRCPFCDSEETQVRDSRPTEDGTAIRRRRSCAKCGQRFTTFERVLAKEPTIKKRDGTLQPFDRLKLERSIRIALRKRPVEDDRVERVVNAIIKRLENMGDSEVSSAFVGDCVMEALRKTDMVAYVRYASVYKDFADLEEFQAFIERLRSDVAQDLRPEPQFDLFLGVPEQLERANPGRRRPERAAAQ